MRLAVIFGISAILAATGARAETAEPTSITLSCEGTIKDAGAINEKPQVIGYMGLVVDLTARSVAGFGGIVAHIDRADAAGISFSGHGVDTTVAGEIDRVTGAVFATTTTTALIWSYDLLCKPTKRLF
jgi:hypothetical protein